MKLLKTIKCEECGLPMKVPWDFLPKYHALCSDWCAAEYATRREEDKKNLTTETVCVINVDDIGASK